MRETRILGSCGAPGGLLRIELRFDVPEGRVHAHRLTEGGDRGLHAVVIRRRRVELERDEQAARHAAQTDIRINAIEVPS